MDDPAELTRRRRSGIRASLSAMNVVTVEQSWLPPLVHLSYNLLTLVGLFLLNAATVIWLFVLPVMTREAAQHPYLLVFFLGILPLVFLLGLVLTPLGIYLRYRRATRRETRPRIYAPLGWQNREFRHLSSLFGIATGINVLAGGYLSQAAVDYMDSPGFCSATCHSMSPEYAAYQDSPHLKVECVECHIGPGRRAYVRAKLNGLWQVSVTMLNSYPRPIPTPLNNLRPAQEICESCHWPQKFSGIRLRVIDHFAEDSANTHTKTVLALAIGGGPMVKGIHGFHVAPGVTIEYAADERREKIYWVRYTNPEGIVTEYAADAWHSAERPAYEIRTMDCLDCHTRPSHKFRLPQRALDEALALGSVDSTLPWIKTRGVEILLADYVDAADAERRIPSALHELYRTEYPDLYRDSLRTIEHSAAGLLAIYKRNVFPEMGVAWGTYPDHSGHNDFIGCVRCHGAGLKTADGTSITAECTACHRILALREREPEVLEKLGM